KSNEERINYIVSLIMEKHPQVVGIYRLTMKAGSDNMRQAVISEVMKLLEKQNVNLIIYEPLIKETHYQGHKVINDLQVFIAQASLIVANRSDDLIKSAKEKLLTRDIFHTDK
ncbi:MAG TPA: UDP-glucose 6-dehydrogenase, partial [Firmicutes bacterium]|nr:UDP-glucose 6-dehydrogenase [Bacillota bacterium]